MWFAPFGLSACAKNGCNKESIVSYPLLFNSKAQFCQYIWPMILAFVAYKSLPKQYKNVQHWNSRK